MSAAPALRPADRLLAAAIAAGAFAWFAAQPRNLGVADEAYLLVEASRVAGGELLYRDVFWLAMPAAHWLVAAAFALFGTTITTAKLCIGAVNALTAALAFTAARALGVRAILALLPPLAFLALAQPAWPYVSPHWFSTAAIMALFVAGAPPAALERPRRLFAAGLALGLLGSVHQQKGPVLALALALAIVAASAIRRSPGAPGWFRRLATVAAGALAVLLPVLAVMIASQDVRRLIDDVLLFPLTGYRQYHDFITWGEVGVLNRHLAAYVSPRLLYYLPVLLPLGGAAAALGCARGWPRGRVVQWSTALLLCAGSLLSIGYNADFIHIAFSAAPCFVLAALLLDAAVDLLPRPARRPAGLLAGGVLALLLGLWLAANDARMRAEYPLVAETAFGRVAFRDQREVDTSARVDRLLDAEGRRELFIYPYYVSLYLTAGGRDPLRFLYVFHGHSWPEHFDEVQRELDEKRVPLVLVVTPLLLPDDPFVAGLETHYVKTEEEDGLAIYRRRER